MQEIRLTQNTSFSHPFHNKKIVFTGALSTMTRSSAAKLVVKCGAILQGNVTTETDFVILGSKRKGISSKHRQAMKLEMTGHHIQIIEEEDFYWLLSMVEA